MKDPVATMTKETWNRREFLGATLTATAAMTAARPLTARAETVAAAPPAATGKLPLWGRREVFLASKTTRRDYDGAMAHLETSFKRMQTDHLDLWQIHNLQKMEDVDTLVAGDHQGRDAVFAQFGRYGGETNGTFRADLKQVFGSDSGRVVAIHHNSGERNGKRLDSDCCIVFKVRNGQMVSGQEHFFDLYNWDAFWA